MRICVVAFYGLANATSQARNCMHVVECIVSWKMQMYG